MKLLDIGKISEATGLLPSALRYYEELGLITSVGRHGLRRQFPPETLMRLSLVTLGQSAGFSLQEIVGIFGPHPKPILPRALLRQRAEEIGSQIKDLMALQKLLRHVAECRAPSHIECPKFQQLMRMATRDKRQHGRKKAR